MITKEDVQRLVDEVRAGYEPDVPYATKITAVNALVKLKKLALKAVTR